MGTYEPCVLGSDGNCTRWSHDHAADRPSVTDNARAETNTGAIARGEALAAGDPDWMNVTRWPRTEAEATTVILRLIKQAQNYNAEADRHASRVVAMEAENEDLTAERDALAARLAAVEDLVAEWERVQKQNRKALGELARGTSHLLLDTPGPADFRAALAAPTDTTKEN